MPSDALTAIYRAHPATLRQLLDGILETQADSRITTVEGLVGECGMSRRRAINLLRALAKAGLGEFKLGRKGHPSRLEWAQDPQALVEQLDAVDVPSDSDSDSDSDSGSDSDDDAPDEPQSQPINGELIFDVFPHQRAKPDPIAPPARAALIQHSYVLRPQLRILVELPEDLTAREAEVLGKWVRNLSFDR